MPSEAIHTYTRAQALEDGQLIDVTATAREARFRHPVALTRAAWIYAVAWDDANPEPQDEAVRLWDVLYMAGIAAGRAAGEQYAPFALYRVPNTERPQSWREAERITLRLAITRGDQGEPVITIMCPYED